MELLITLCKVALWALLYLVLPAMLVYLFRNICFRCGGKKLRAVRNNTSVTICSRCGTTLTITRK